jgi:hypothetical protein
MGHAIAVRTDYTADEVRRLAKRVKDAAQARRLLHAAELAIEPRLQILRRHRRSLLLCLEHPYRPTVEDHVHCPTRLGEHRSSIVRIGIMRDSALLWLILPE